MYIIFRLIFQSTCNGKSRRPFLISEKEKKKKINQKTSLKTLAYEQNWTKSKNRIELKKWSKLKNSIKLKKRSKFKNRMKLKKMDKVKTTKMDKIKK